MTLSQQDLAALAGLIDAKIAAAVGSTEEPEAAPKSAVKATAAKASSVARKLDSMLVVPGSAPIKFVPGTTALPEGVAFEITPCYGQGGVRSSGAAVVPYSGGRKMRSLNAVTLAALTPDTIETLSNAIETVDRAAKIGEHAAA